MGFLRFRRTLKILPGVRLNLGKKSASVSIGPRGAKYTVGTKGSRVTVGIPGTGMSYTETDPLNKLKGKSAKAPSHSQKSPEADQTSSGIMRFLRKFFR